MWEPVHGKDYLIDYYAVLGVPRDADPDALRAAYIKLRQQWNPDRVQGMAQQIVEQTTKKAALVTEAYKVLGDPEKRAEFDRKLTNWAGPISTSGNPVVDPTAPHFDPRPLLFGGAATPAAREKAERLLEELAPGDAGMLAMVEQMLEKSGAVPDEQQLAIVRRLLAAKNKRLAMQASFQWELLGFSGRIAPVLGRKMLEQAATAVQDSRLFLAEQGANIARQIAGGDLKLLNGATEASLELSSPESQQAFVADALARYDQGVEELKRIQEEREDVYRKMAAALAVRYPGEQPELFDDFVVGLRQFGEILGTFSFHVDGNNVRIVEDLAPDPIALFGQPDRMAAVVAGRVNVLVVEIVECLEIRDHLELAVRRHLAKKMGTSLDEIVL